MLVLCGFDENKKDDKQFTSRSSTVWNNRTRTSRCVNRLTTFSTKRSMAPCLFFETITKDGHGLATVKKDASDNVVAPDRDTLLEEPFCATDVPSSCQVKIKRRSCNSSTRGATTKNSAEAWQSRAVEAQRLIPFDLFRDVRKLNSEYVREAHRTVATCLVGAFNKLMVAKMKAINPQKPIECFSRCYGDVQTRKKISAKKQKMTSKHRSSNDIHHGTK